MAFIGCVGGSFGYEIGFFLTWEAGIAGDAVQLWATDYTTGYDKR